MKYDDIYHTRPRISQSLSLNLDQIPQNRVTPPAPYSQTCKGWLFPARISSRAIFHGRLHVRRLQKYSLDMHFCMYSISGGQNIKLYQTFYSNVAQGMGRIFFSSSPPTTRTCSSKCHRLFIYFFTFSPKNSIKFTLARMSDLCDVKAPQSFEGFFGPKAKIHFVSTLSICFVWFTLTAHQSSYACMPFLKMIRDSLQMIL